MDLVAEVWDALKYHIQPTDRSEAAETLVNLLIDNDFSPADIKAGFKSDSEIKQALKDYAAEHEDEDEYEEEEEDYEDEDEWN